HVPVPLTPDYGGPIVRYADGVVDLQLDRYVTVREDHRESKTNPSATIVSVELSGDQMKEPTILVGGSDFYAFPRLTPDGKKMAWIEWSHPNMPWDKAELWVGYLSADGKIEKRVCIAGKDPNLIESPSEPKWSTQGELFFVTSTGRMDSGICTNGSSQRMKCKPCIHWMQNLQGLHGYLAIALMLSSSTRDRITILHART
ncbi:hypothetical protein KI387_015417, partial [Taxus chinensis]